MSKGSKIFVFVIGCLAFIYFFAPIFPVTNGCVDFPGGPPCKAESKWMSLFKCQKIGICKFNKF